MMDSRKLLQKYNLQPKKSFGQNFLIAEGIVEKIASAAARATTPPAQSAIEIGAGLGALTASLLTKISHVVAIERDRDLVPVLASELESQLQSGALEILEDDAASLDYQSIVARLPSPTVLVGNLPYQITGKLLSIAGRLARQGVPSILMVQKEVGDRLVAAPNTENYGQLSVFAQAACSVQRLFVLSPNCFHPRPSIDSVVMQFSPGSPRAEESKTFVQVVHQAFGARRKTLKNALSPLLSNEAILARVAATNIQLERRGETLSVEEFATLACAIDLKT